MDFRRPLFYNPGFRDNKSLGFFPDLYDQNVRCTQFTSLTTTGKQTIKINGFNGSKPVGAMFIFNGNNMTSNATVDHAILGMGLADGETQGVVVVTDEHNQGTTDTSRIHNDSNSILILDENNNTIAKAQFSKFVSNGIEIEWITNTLSSGVLITCVLFNNIEFKVGWIQNSSSAYGTVDIETGFNPGCVFGLTSMISSKSAIWTNSIIQFMFSCNNTAKTQFNSMVISYDNLATSDIRSRLSTDTFMLVGGFSNVVLSSYNDTGFTLLNGNFTSTQYMLYCATGKVKNKQLSIIDSPTTIGDKIYNTGHRSQFSMTIGTLSEIVNATYSDQHAGSLSISVSDKYNQYVHAISMQDNVVTSVTKSTCLQKLIYLTLNDGSQAFEGNLKKVLNYDLVYNLEKTNSTLRKWIMFSVGN